MFNNLVNTSDIYRVIEKLRQGEINKIINRLIPARLKDKVKKAWEYEDTPPKNWWNIPAVEKRLNSLVTGNLNKTFYEYTAEKFLNNAQNLIGLSICCGTGHAEIEWIKTNAFHRIDGVDLSPSRIEFAIEQAKSLRLESKINYYVDDILNFEIINNKYDVIFAEGALHHLTPMDSIIKKLKDNLKPGGLLILNDFVGPTRFQWTKKQLKYVNELLQEVPHKYRKRWKSNTIKSKHYRPSKLSMILSDPSEAVESSQIIKTLDKYFELVEIKNLGGTLLQLFFNDIAHNFLNDNEETQRWLEFIFAWEDELMAKKEIESDFVFAVYRKKG